MGPFLVGTILQHKNIRRIFLPLFYWRMVVFLGVFRINGQWHAMAPLRVAENEDRCE